MPRVAFNALRKKKSTTRRRPTSVITRAKYTRKTTRTNRALIKANAYAIRTLKRMQPSLVYCDWQLSGTLYATIDPTPGNFTSSYAIQPLMDPQSWDPVLRRDDNAEESSATMVKRMQMNLRYTLQTSDYAQFTTFVVSVRKDSANRAIVVGNLTEGRDFILSAGQDFNCRVSPSLFKVHYVSNHSLTKNTWLSNAASIGDETFAGNPMTTFKKGQVNMKLNFRIRQPNQGLSWTQMGITQFSPAQRLYLITFVTQNSQSAVAASGARLDYDALFTTVNQS